MKKIAKGLLAGFTAAAMTGCLGHNALFNNVQDWNADLEANKFLKQGVSFAFWIIPVYPLTLLADVVVLNSVEFWTGENPVSSSSARVTYVGEDGSRMIEDGLGNSAILTPLDDERIQVVSVVNGKSHEMVLKREGALIQGFDTKGEMIGLARHPDLLGH